MEMEVQQSSYDIEDEILLKSNTVYFRIFVGFKLLKKYFWIPTYLYAYKCIRDNRASETVKAQRKIFIPQIFRSFTLYVWLLSRLKTQE